MFALCYELMQTIVFEHVGIIHNANVKIILENIKRFATYHQGTYDYSKADSNSEMC